MELTAKVRELKELKLLADELAAQIGSIEDEIKAEMGDREELIVDCFKVRWTKVTSRRFDTTAFKVECADLYARFTKPVETRRFSVA